MTTDQKHTPEPWVIDERESLSTNFYSDDATGSIIGECPDYSFAHRSIKERRANARRIVACVNFCEGLPSGELLMGRAKTAIENMNAAMDENKALQARVKELEAQLNVISFHTNLRPFERIAALEEQRDELLELIKAHGSICGTCMCGAQFLPSGDGHCDNHAYTDMFDHYSRKLIAKIEAEKRS